MRPKRPGRCFWVIMLVYDCRVGFEGRRFGMKRDFTQATQDKLRALVQEADEKWFEWTDSLGDFFLGVGMSEVIGHFGGI